MVSYHSNRKWNDNLPPTSRVVRPKDKSCLLLTLALIGISFILFSPSMYWRARKPMCATGEGLRSKNVGKLHSNCTENMTLRCVNWHCLALRSPFTQGKPREVTLAYLIKLVCSGLMQFLQLNWPAVGLILGSSWPPTSPWGAPPWWTQVDLYSHVLFGPLLTSFWGLTHLASSLEVSFSYQRVLTGVS